MMKIKVCTDNDIYNKLVENLKTLYPEMEIEKLGDDYYLYNLYDINSVSTMYIIKTTEEEIEKVLEILKPYRVTKEERDSKMGEKYEQYLKYGWMWDFFSGLKEYGEKEDPYQYHEHALIDREDPTTYYARLEKEAKEEKKEKKKKSIFRFWKK